MRDTERLDRFSFPPSKRVVQRERPAGGGESASVSTLCFCSWPQIKHIDAKIELAVKSDERAKRLTTIPSVGPVTAVTFIALVDEIARFSSSAKLCSYLGLVPREHSSGEKQQRGHITKTGNSRLRSLLVECAWGILRRANPRTEALSQWALRIAARRGKRIAAIALARKLAAILFAMTQHGRDFEPDRIRRAPQAAAA